VVDSLASVDGYGKDVDDEKKTAYASGQTVDAFSKSTVRKCMTAYIGNDSRTDFSSLWMIGKTLRTILSRPRTMDVNGRTGSVRQWTVQK
jgi:predicted butyrate kinase (DUF1464 family)